MLVCSNVVFGGDMKNPIIQGWYADPESRVYNGKVYIYVTKSLPYEEQLNIDLVVSEDLKTFTLVKDVLDFSTFHGIYRCVWAPSAIEKDGKYYIIFAGNAKNPEIHVRMEHLGKIRLDNEEKMRKIPARCDGNAA